MSEVQFGSYKTQECLVVPIQNEFYDDDLGRLQQAILKRLNDDSSIGGVVIDLSGVNIIDGFIFKALLDLSRMTEFMGRRTVFTGFKPSVASALVELSIDTDDLNSFTDLESAISFFQRQSEKKSKESEETLVDGDSAAETEGTEE